MTRSLDGLVRVLAFNRPHLLRRFFQRIEMHHPVEDDGMKLSAGGIALFFSGNRTAQAKPWMRSQRVLLAFGRLAVIHMLMPLRDAERNALVQILFGETLGSGIHHAHKPVAAARL